MTPPTGPELTSEIGRSLACEDGMRPPIDCISEIGAA